MFPHPTVLSTQFPLSVPTIRRISSYRGLQRPWGCCSLNRHSRSCASHKVSSVLEGRGVICTPSDPAVTAPSSHFTVWLILGPQYLCLPSARSAHCLLRPSTSKQMGTARRGPLSAGSCILPGTTIRNLETVCRKYSI